MPIIPFANRGLLYGARVKSDAGCGFAGIHAARQIRLRLGFPSSPTASIMAHENLVTIAEQSGFRHTGRTEEVERLCAAFAKTWPDSVKMLDYGTSAEGRRMLALVVAHGDPRKVPMLMLQGGIHPGESDGKDAGFIALREMLSDPAKSALLERVSILFVPAFNVDGHERFGRWNRPTPAGPEETGWRTPAQNLNLNRDYTKADAPEMQAMLKLINTWEPLVCADLHVT